MIQVELSRIIIDEKRQDQVIVLKEKDGDRQIPIVIGFMEASSIKIKISGVDVPRPMTHDLIRTMLDTLEITIDRVVIHDIKNNTFFAKIHLIKDGKEYEIDSRPSDAIAMALRMEASIFVSEHVIMEATIMDKDKYEKEMKEFKEFLKDIKPSDFINYKE